MREEIWTEKIFKDDAGYFFEDYLRELKWDVRTVGRVSALRNPLLRKTLNP